MRDDYITPVIQERRARTALILIHGYNTQGKSRPSNSIASPQLLITKDSHDITVRHGMLEANSVCRKGKESERLSRSCVVIKRLTAVGIEFATLASDEGILEFGCNSSMDRIALYRE